LQGQKRNLLFDVHVKSQARTEGHKLTDALKFRMIFHDVRLVKQGDEWMISSLDQQEFQRVAIESDAFEGTQNGVQDRAAGD
jgi:hypothetical protein